MHGAVAHAMPQPRVRCSQTNKDCGSFVCTGQDDKLRPTTLCVAHSHIRYVFGTCAPHSVRCPQPRKKDPEPSHPLILCGQWYQRWAISMPTKAGTMLMLLALLCR
jgi:hypothetical protein